MKEEGKKELRNVLYLGSGRLMSLYPQKSNQMIDSDANAL